MRSVVCGLLRVGLVLMFVSNLRGIGVCAESSSKMIHAIVQMSGTDIPPDSFFTKPKTFWRSDSKYCRVDEEPDADKGIHGRLVVNEPDAWLINLADNTAKHVLDPGPTFHCRQPVFAMDEAMAKGKIGELEIGSELNFFHSHGATLVDGPKLLFKANYYELEIGDSVLRLVERADIHAPIMIRLLRGDKEYKARYLLWEELPFKADLFAKPTGVTIEDAK
jgi:hypothetical protein